MLHGKRVSSGIALAAAILTIAGCGHSAPTAPASAGKDTPPVAGEVEPASVESPLNQPDDAVEQAVATAPADRVMPLPGEPARLPENPSQPLPDESDEPLPELPLEEPLDSGTTMPQVHFTEAHAKTNLVGVGDAFPKLNLPNLQGETRSFGELLGDKLTIVVFWNATLPAALEELAGIQSRFVDEFGSQGVAVIGINVGDDPQLAAEVAGQAGATYPQLSDRDGKALSQVATERLPRTYLIDTSGQILWFDTEYSRTTRQQLLAALRFSLKDE